MSSKGSARLPGRLTDEDLARISFDVIQLTDRLSAVEDWAKLVAAHIYLDHILTETLRDRIPDIDVYLKSGHKTFADKLALCQAHRVVDEELVATLKALNRARNQFAHRLDFGVTDELKMQLFTQFSPTRAKADVLGDEGFTNFLLTVIMLLEFERIYEFKIRALQEEAQLYRDKAFEVATRTYRTRRAEE
ncbi:hypothetical protein HFO09_08905 [Rhizobium laguerreae]|uniref:hypothetical protein n=1 Tax=Rhizobium laguerreae TaxID=1076926 RepID=UPI001C90A9B9|nr:hypothetical protein [Rhizobium laguerreae]MBY3255804.1 hypothetical protein [Rhizobium laguerreae]MBY3282843.1 hypothetical protein [Rhizobium laguerreae]MBY3289197.1 hypothetical protein [Rhizobium laguerreae]